MISKTYAYDVKNLFLGSPRYLEAKMFDDDGMYIGTHQSTRIHVYEIYVYMYMYIYIYMNSGLHTQKTKIQVGDLNKTTAPATCLIHIDSKTGSDFNNQKMGAP